MADLLTIDEFAYEIRFYRPEAIGVKTGTTYSINAGHQPFAVWRVESPDRSTNVYNNLVVSRIADGHTNKFEYGYTEATKTWTLVSGGGLRTESAVTSTNAIGRVVTKTVSDAGGMRSQVISQLKAFSWGEEVVQKTEWVDDRAPFVTTYDYYEDPQAVGTNAVRPNVAVDGYKKFKIEASSDGNWTKYTYDYKGRTIKEVRPWLDATTNSPENECDVRTFDYVSHDPALDLPVAGARKPRTESQFISGQLASRIYHVYYTQDVYRVHVQERAVAPDCAYGDSRNLRTVEFDNLSDRPVLMEHADGRQDQYTYTAGNYGSGVSNAPGTFTTSATGAYTRVEFVENVTHLAANKSVKTVTIENEFWQPMLRETWVCTAGGASPTWERVDWQVLAYDADGHETGTHYANGLSRQSTWDCCGKTSEVEPDGQTTIYVLDALGRVGTRIQQGVTGGLYGAQADIQTHFEYDAEGRVLEEIVSADGLSLTATRQYDGVGRVTNEVQQGGLTTRHFYAAGTKSSSSATVYLPSGAQQTRQLHADGRTRSQAASASAGTFYSYGVETNGAQWTIVTTGATNSPATTKTVTDFAGRHVRSERPAYGGGVLVQESFYDDEGRLVRSSSTGSPDTLYAYDARGEQYRSAMDVDMDGSIDLSGPDRVNESLASFIKVGAVWYRQSASVIYAQESGDAATTVSVSRVAIGGSGCSCQAGEQVSFDIRGNATHATASLDPGARIVTKTTDHPDSTTDAVTIACNGRLMESLSKTGVRTTYSYDALGRQIAAESVSGSGGSRKTGQYTAYDGAGRVVAVWDAASNKTAFGYDAAGRRVAVTNALGVATFTAYDLQGRVLTNWGATYPVAYQYDGHGRMAALLTWRDESGSPDVTRWHYDEATGLLTNKVYADTNGVAYAYDPAGRLTSRTWSRNVATTYAYDLLGQLTNISYSDSTPTVEFSYDRLGRQESVVDGTGGRAFTYSDLLQLDQETNAHGVIVRDYDALGRPAIVSLGADFDTKYGYDPVGRLASVTSVVHGIMTHLTRHDYAFVPGSDLLAGLKSDGLESAYHYDTRRDVRTGITNLWDNGGTKSPVGSFSYTYDALGRRTDRVDSGTEANSFDYNPRSELVGAEMGTNSYGYVYDGIGNRLVYTNNGAVTTYAANELNQYTNISPSAGNPVYDADGNMTYDGTWAYGWDAENRLVSIDPATTNAGTRRLRFTFDYMSRRVGKVVEEYDGSAWTNALTATYVYDGWNLLSESRSDQPKVNYYVWGLDLSQTLQGAGGVGGLQARVREGNLPAPLYYAYDANGNVTEVVDKDGASAAHYAYDGFGNTIVQSGPEAAANPYRFSTKYTDDETGLLYYGFRYYSPSLGRWFSRDPINERGGVNLYMAINNAVVQLVDALGHKAGDPCCCCCPKNIYRFAVTPPFTDWPRPPHGSLTDGLLIRTGVRTSYHGSGTLKDCTMSWVETSRFLDGFGSGFVNDLHPDDPLPENRPIFDEWLNRPKDCTQKEFGPMILQDYVGIEHGWPFNHFYVQFTVSLRGGEGCDCDPEELTLTYTVEIVRDPTSKKILIPPSASAPPGTIVGQ
jgi:RHS repeat-associated protein